MSLADRLVSQTPTERSGPTAANRFDFQLDWALCKLLELHASGADYVIVMDYHDDVLILDSASDPQWVACYQVKTKGNNNWTINSISKPAKGKKGPLPSIIAKMFQHTISFPDAIAGLYFVSNAPLRATDKSNKSTLGAEHIRFADLCDDEQETLRESICAQCNTSDATLDQFEYERTGLSVTGHETHSLGAVASFLESLPEIEPIPAPAFYRTLKSELGRAMRDERAPTTFEELCSVKAATRGRFETILAKACAAPRREDAAADICSRLNMEGVAFAEVQAMRSSVRRLSIERMTQDMELIDALSVIQRAIQDGALPADLWGIIETIRTSAPVASAELEFRYGRPHLRAMIATTAYELGQLQSPDSGAAGAQG